MKFFTNLFKTPSIEEVVAKELDLSKRSLLRHQSETIYHQKMAQACQENIRRLEEFNQTN